VTIPHSHNLQRLAHSPKPRSIAKGYELWRLIHWVAGGFGACDTAATWCGSANSTRSRGSRIPIECRCGSAATRRIGRWQPSPQFLSPHRPSPRCPSLGVTPGRLRWVGVHQSLCCREHNGCYVQVRVGFLSCLFPFFQSIHPRHWLLHSSQGFWISQCSIYLWVLY